MIWLLAVLFALPASVGAACSCETAGLRACCGSDSLVDGQSLPIGALKSVEVSRRRCGCTNGSASLSRSFPLSCCPRDCPCQCDDNDPTVVVSFLRGQDSREDAKLVTLCRERGRFKACQTLAFGVLLAPPVRPTSALDRCVLLSRFLL